MVYELISGLTKDLETDKETASGHTDKPETDFKVSGWRRFGSCCENQFKSLRSFKPRKEKALRINRAMGPRRLLESTQILSIHKYVAGYHIRPLIN